MTACTMSSDYGVELLLGTSPVLTSPFPTSSGSLFSDFPRCGNGPGVWDVSPSRQPNYYSADSLVEQFSDLRTSEKLQKTYARTGSLRRSKKLDRLKKEFAQNKPLLLTNPAKSILRQIDEQAQEYSSEATSPSKEKKKVSFADTIGQQLTQIKLITERPDCPPLWSTDFIEKVKVTGGVTPDPPTTEWQLTFAQPVADYVNFKNKLDREYITLENVIIDARKAVAKGTVSVRNISFHKDVLIRYTINNWATSSDINATYVPSPVTSSAYDLYDRFSFELPLPQLAESDKVEFCIRFSTNGVEYWDNNNGRNYTIISFTSKNKESSKPKTSDAYRLDMGSWSQFASWNLQNDKPYW